MAISKRETAVVTEEELKLARRANAQIMVRSRLQQHWLPVVDGISTYTPQALEGLALKQDEQRPGGWDAVDEIDAVVQRQNSRYR